ncbi:MAG: cell division protein FtsQ/DivIB [Thermoanaerobaculia bacterium]
MSVYGSSDRFFRPVDLGSTPRNYRKLQARRILIAAANVLFVAALLLGGLWTWRKAQEDARFAIQSIEISGVVHAPGGAIEAAAARWEGANLFRLDLDAIRTTLGANPWVGSVAVEKELPGTLHVAITERRPAALVARDGALWYVDAGGVVFAPLSPQIGDGDLPLVNGAGAAEIEAAVTLLESLRANAPDLYARVSQIEPRGAGGFAIWDRDLSTTVLVTPETAAKWRLVHAIARAEGWPDGSVEYADVRFRDRIVIKPRNG